MAKFTWDQDHRQQAKRDGTALLGFSADYKAGKATISTPDAEQSEVSNLVGFMIRVMSVGQSPKEAFAEVWGEGGDRPVVKQARKRKCNPPSNTNSRSS